MSATSTRLRRGAPFLLARAVSASALLVVIAALGACGTVDSATRRIATSFTPYRPVIVQGNFVSREQAQALRPGMTRQQVRDVLGTPLVASVFHADRWDYVFTLKQRGVPDQLRRFTVWFKGDLFDRYEAVDPLPSESEFLGLLEARGGTPKVPVLEATQAQLERFPAPTRSAAASEPQAPARADYPPLEAPR